MVALEHINMEFSGITIDDELSNPNLVIFLSVCQIYLLLLVMSVGTHQGISPSQYSLTFVFGVPPEKMSQIC